MRNKAGTNPSVIRAAAIRSRGLTLIETALVLAIMALVVASLSLMMADNADQIRARAAADKITEVHEAAQGYMKANYGALLAQAASGPVTVPSGRATAGGAVPSGPGGLPSLQGGGYLLPGYIDTNGYGQRHSLVIRRVTGNPTALEAIVTTHGGRVIPDRQLGRIANMVGAKGGYVAVKNVVASDAGQVVGSYGGWRTAITGWGATAPAAGHVQTALAFEDGTLLTDYLYRNDIGIPEANRMSTNIDMNGNDLNNVKVVRGKDGSLGIEGDARVTVDVWSRDLNASRNVTATQNVVAGNDVRAGNDVTATRHVAAGQDVTAGRNVTAANDISATGNGTVGRNMTVGQNLQVNGNAGVTGNANVGGLLTAAQIDGSAKITGFAPFVAAGATLNDLLPKSVPQYSYMVTPGQQVPKPTCRGGYGNARIMVYPQSESSRSTANVSGTTSSNGGTTHTHTFSSTVNVDTSVAVYATSNAATWTVNWTGNPVAPGGERRAVAQTFCFYG